MEILHHLNEVERCGLHLARGCSSLFVYCTTRLGYSESAAGRRIAAARAMRRVPALEALLRSGEMTLSAAAMAAPLLTAQSQAELLPRLRSKSQREVEAVLAERREPEAVRERIRPVVQKKKEAVAAGTPVPAPAPTRDEVRYEFRFAASREFREKFERARALMSGKFAGGAGAEQVLEAALDAYLERHDPERRAERRRSRDSRGPAAVEPGRRPSTSLPLRERPRTRAIPAALRDQVWRRDVGRCTYAAPDGRRCGSTWDVEVHHDVPYRDGGEHSIRNLRLLCSAHNRHVAETELGPAYMRQFCRRE